MASKLRDERSFSILQSFSQEVPEFFRDELMAILFKLL